MAFAWDKRRRGRRPTAAANGSKPLVATATFINNIHAECLKQRIFILGVRIFQCLITINANVIKKPALKTYKVYLTNVGQTFKFKSNQYNTWTGLLFSNKCHKPRLNVIIGVPLNPSL